MKNGPPKYQDLFIKDHLSQQKFKTIFYQGLGYFKKTPERTQEFFEKYCANTIIFGFNLKNLLGGSFHEFKKYNTGNNNSNMSG